jgi:hypothetical protein
MLMLLRLTCRVCAVSSCETGKTIDLWSARNDGPSIVSTVSQSPTAQDLVAHNIEILTKEVSLFPRQSLALYTGIESRVIAV